MSLFLGTNFGTNDAFIIMRSHASKGKKKPRHWQGFF